jgi:hypothetical protein
VLAFWIRADLDEAAFRGDELRGFGPATLEVFKKEKLLKRGEDLRVVECGDCGNPHLEDVEVITDSPDGIPRAYIACGPGRVSVRLGELQVWAIDFDRLAHLTRSALGLGGRIVQVATDRVWLLGSGRLVNKTRDVFLVRGIRWSDSLQLLVGNARLSTSPCPLILCMNRVPDDADWHGHERVVMSLSESDWLQCDRSTLLARTTEILCEHGGSLVDAETPSGAETTNKVSRVGLVFSEADGLAGIDLDDCLDEEGDLKAWARGVVEQFSDTYMEISPGGRGLKIWARGALPANLPGVKVGDGQIEMYDHARYFAVTGRAFRGAPLQIENHETDLHALYKHLVSRKKRWKIEPLAAS